MSLNTLVTTIFISSLVEGLVLRCINENISCYGILLIDADEQGEERDLSPRSLTTWG